MAWQEIVDRSLAANNGDAASEPSAMVSSRITFDCGSQALPAAIREGLQLIITDNETSPPETMKRDVSAAQHFKENILHGLVTTLQTFNVHRSNGKIVAKVEFIMRRTSSASTCLDVKLLCVKGNGLLVSSCSISRSFLLNKTHLPRFQFHDLVKAKLQQKSLPCLQWYNHAPQRQEWIHKGGFVHDYEVEIQQLEDAMHHRITEATNAGDKDTELQQGLGYKTTLITSLENEVINLKHKLNRQSHELKVCHDQLLELKGNIRVFCRCRPLTSDEATAGNKSIVEFSAMHNNELYVHTQDGAKKPFKFDCVFSPSDNQEDVFRETAPLVVSVLDGFNVCIFAYGQTGTGKTFTMEGSKDNRGVNYRTLEKLFQQALERKGQYTYDISVSVLEVYNEEIRDLLTPSTPAGQSGKKLEIKRIAEGTHHLPGVTETVVHSIEDVWKVLQVGSKARAVGCTNANKHSSRSHCMVCVAIKGENLCTRDCTKSRLWLVDLAGSERIGKTDAQGDRLKEAQNINKSLSALGDVVHALASKSSHIPYRNSKITHLLQDSLGGQSKTLMFVQISPSDQDAGETLCSLNFATRVRGVEVGAARKQLDPAELLKYKKLAEKAKQDVVLRDETIKELQYATKVKEQTCKALSSKVKEKENLFEAERKARSIAEEKVKEQHTVIEKQKKMIERLSAEIKATLQESAGQKIASNVQASTPRRLPLQEKLTENVPETYQRLMKKGTEGFLQKENTCSKTDADVRPAKTLPRRVSTSIIPHQWSSSPAATPLAGPLPQRRALQLSVQETDFEKCSTQGVVPRHRGRASLCVLPERQPSSLACTAAPPPSPVVKLAGLKRRASMVCSTAPSSVDLVGATLPAGRFLPHQPLMSLREPQRILFRSPLQYKPGTSEYNTIRNVEINSSNAVSRGGGGMPLGMPKARYVKAASVAPGKPPQHPHQAVNRELQYQQPKRSIVSPAGEELDDRRKKMRRFSTLPPLSWEGLPQATPVTPSRAGIPGDAERMLWMENQRPNPATHMMSFAAPSLPWEKPQQILATGPASPAHMLMFGGAQRVPLTAKKPGIARRDGVHQKERGWNR